MESNRCEKTNPIKNILPESKPLVALAIVCLTLCLIFVGLIFLVGVLPPIINIAIAIVVFALSAASILLMRSKKEKIKKYKPGVILAVLLSIVLAIGIHYLYSTYSVFNLISGSNTQTEEFYVIVLKDSEYKELKDIDGQAVLVTDVQGDTYKEAKKLLRKDINVIYSAAGDYLQLGHRLIGEDGKLHDEIIFVSNTYYDMLCEEIDNFRKETKIIYTVSVDIDAIDLTKHVDVTKEAFTIYISGIDTYGRIENVSRSDVNMLMTVNPVSKKILLTSIPRDMYVTLHSFGAKDKLTHSGLYGINETVTTVEDWLGIDINYYVRVNFTTLIDVVDAIGGVDVDSECYFSSSVSDYSYVQGHNHLSGEAALYFARERKSLPDGDGSRIKNQQRVLKGIIDKITSSPVILTKYTQLLKSMEGKVQTSLTDDDIAALVQAQLEDLGGWEIEMISIDGQGTSSTTYSMGDRQVYVAIPNEESVQTAQRIINDVLIQ